MIENPFLFCLLILLVSTKVNSQAIPQTYNAFQQNGYANLQTPSEYTPYYQDITAQNQPALEPSIKQILLDKLLSSPSVQAILNPTASNYSLNTYASNHNQISNTVGNVPTEINTTKDGENHENRKKKKKRKSKRKKNKNNLEKAVVDEEKTRNPNRSAKNNDNTNKKTKKRKNRPTDMKKIRNQDENTTTRPKRRKSKETDVTNTSDEGKKKKPKRKRKKQKGNNITDELKQDNTKQLNLPTGHISVSELNEGNAPEEYRITRNPTSEPNMIKTWNDLPQDYTKNLFSGVNNPFYNPVIEQLFNNYYKPILTQETNRTASKKKKPKQKRRQKTKPEAKPQEPAKIVTKVIVVDEEVENIENNVYNNETRYPKENLILDTFKEDNSKAIEEIEITTNEIPKEEKREENPIEDMDYNYYGYIDDYYPTFFDSAAYNADHTEFYIDNFNYNGQNTKPILEYHKFNKNPTLKEIHRNKISNYEILREEKLTTTTESTIQIIETPKPLPEINKIAQKEEEIIFRTPPILNSPDFITRPIDKSEIKQEFQQPKTKEYYFGDKSDIFNSLENMNNDIETTFAKSKVVKYGPYDDYKVDLWKDFDNNDGTVYVIAKSVDDPNTYW